MITLSPVADDTAELEGALADIFASGKGATIHFNPGVYTYTRSIRMHPDAANRTWKNITFEGEGDGYASNPSVMLRYQATAATDPANFQNGLFDICSGIGINFGGMNILNDAEGVNQTVLLRSEDPALLSSWKSSFTRVGFQCIATAAKHPALGHVRLYNALDARFEQCWFFSAPQALTLGVDPATTSGIAAGGTGRVVLDNCYITGDVSLIRAASIAFKQCVIAEKSSTVNGARILFPDYSYSDVKAVHFDGCQFAGYWNGSVYTDGAILLDSDARSVRVTGCAFERSYSKGIMIGTKAKGVEIRTNDADLRATNSRLITVAAGFAGGLDYGTTNSMSPQMIAAGGKVI